MLMAPRSFAAALACERGSVATGDGALAIPLGRGRGHTALTGEYALVDREEGWVREFNWSKDRWGYARRRLPGPGAGDHIRMHREILGMPRNKRGDHSGGVVDHINRDKLDNRRVNMRVVDGQAENMQNMGSKPGSSSKYRGVSWNKQKQKWYAYCRLNGKMISLGWFAPDKEDEAARVASEYRAKHMPFSSDASAA